MFQDYLELLVFLQIQRLKDYIEIINCPFQEFQLPSGLGLLICNPPYGKRIGDENELPNLYQQLGRYLSLIHI